MFIFQESHTFDTANPRHNMKTIFSASFSLAIVWLVNPIKTRREVARVESGVNIGHVLDEKMAWNVVNGANRSFWSSIYIWCYTWFSVTAGVTLIFLKNVFFRKHRKTNFLGVGLSRKTLMTWNLVKFVIYFVEYSSWSIFA